MSGQFHATAALTPLKNHVPTEEEVVWAGEAGLDDLENEINIL